MRNNLTAAASYILLALILCRDDVAVASSAQPDNLQTSSLNERKDSREVVLDLPLIIESSGRKLNVDKANNLRKEVREELDFSFYTEEHGEGLDERRNLSWWTSFLSKFLQKHLTV